MPTFNSLKSTLSFDLKASLVVFLVALPLAMGVAMASGYPPAAGLITSIIGGIIVGTLSGAPLQVSGAAAGLTVVMLDSVNRLGLQQTGYAVAIAGVVQVIAGAARTGIWFRAISPAVIQGMLAGIGLLIILSQFHVLFDEPAIGKAVESLPAIPRTLDQIWADGITPATYAGLIGLLTIGILVTWPKINFKPFKVVPSALVGVGVAALAGSVFGLPVNKVVIPDDLLAKLVDFTFPTVANLGDLSIWLTALEIALIASAETLLCAAALDSLHTGPRTQYDRELFAQGIGNSLCGLLGALPMTGVIVRSSANLQAGAKTRGSTILHGLWVLGLVALFPHALEVIPTAALAGVLVYTGAKLVNLKSLMRLAKESYGEAAIFVVTAGTIVMTDLLVGVGVGFLLAGLKLFASFLKLDVLKHQIPGGQQTIVELRGTASFLKLPRLEQELGSLAEGSRVVISGQELNFIDHACKEYLKTWQKRHESLGGKVTFDWGITADAKPKVFGTAKI